MRPNLALLAAIVFGFAAQASAQSCTGLCLQQVSCPSGQTTSISGTVYAPNGVDPLPDVTVYIPNAPVDAFTPGVSCPAPGAPPSGSPLVGTTTAPDGTFTIANVPVGSNIPLVVVTGKWRRQLVIPMTSACANTAFSTRMPRNQSEGDIPRIAVNTGAYDQVECVLRKVGIDDAEFTDPSGTGRINLFIGGDPNSSPNAGGAQVDSSTPYQASLMGDPATLNQYDVIMQPCEGTPITQPSDQLANFVAYANAGGRVYASHYQYVWLYQNPPFDTVVNWDVAQSPLPDGTATVDTSFSSGATLAQWLQIVGASTTPGQIAISTLRHDFNGVIAPTQSWLTLNDKAAGNPVQQFTFNTPVGAQSQCGRVLFNEYHVENSNQAATGEIFPAECSSAAMTPQEKLLEYSLFDLTNNGGSPTLTPLTQDFGTEPVDFTSATQNFTWKNNSIFVASVSLLTATGDFLVTGSNCSGVASNSTCTIGVAFKPTTSGARTGTLTVGSNGNTLIATLTGTGIPTLLLNSASLMFGSVDVGASVTQNIGVTNQANGVVAFPTLATTGDYSASSNCGAFVPALGSCVISITFKPSATGARPGTMIASSNDPAYAAVTSSFTGNGVDFTVAFTPNSGTVIAGLSVTTYATVTPLAGFSNVIGLNCTTSAPGSTCTVGQNGFVPSNPSVVPILITTTPQYTVVGYGGIGGTGLLSLLAAASLLLLMARRKRAGSLLRVSLLLCFLITAGLLTTGCSGKLPSQNSVYTAPGNYTYTVTATDGFLTHSTTYQLNVTTN